MSLLQLFRPRSSGTVTPTVSEPELWGRDCIAGIHGCDGLDSPRRDRIHMCPYCLEHTYRLRYPDG